VSRAYTYSNHVAWILGKSLGLGLAKAKTFFSRPRPRLRPEVQGLGQGHDLKSKAKAKAKTKAFMRCPRGSSRPRPGLEDNKTAIRPVPKCLADTSALV